MWQTFYSQRTIKMSKHISKKIAITYSFFLIYLSLRPIPPEIGNIFSYQDKLMHLSAYVILGALYQKVFRKPQWAIIAAVSLGIGLEIAQSFLSYRSFELLDILANTLGVGIGVWMQNKRLT